MPRSHARHTFKWRPVKVPIYAQDLAQGEGDPDWADDTGNGVSPSWTFTAATRMGVNADIMLPFDWKPGSDLKFYFVYAPTAVGGVGDVLWGIDYVLYPDSIYHGGLGLNPARTIRLTRDTPPFAVVMKRTNNPVCIPGNDLRVTPPYNTRTEQIQIAFIRAGDLIEDADGRASYLFKVIMHYDSIEL